MLPGLLCGIAITIPVQVAALFAKGRAVVPPGKSIFLSKFCFDFDPQQGQLSPGLLNIELANLWPRSGAVDLAMFDDESDSYPDESALQDWKCDSKRLKSMAKWEIRLNASAIPWKGSIQVVERFRPRWFYVAVINCGGVERSLEYGLHMTNPRQGWQQEFSMDQCGLGTLTVFCVLYAALLTAQVTAITRTSETAKTRHPLRLVLSLSTAFVAISSLAMVVDAIWFSRNGESDVRLHLAGKLLKLCSKMVLTSILLLMSRGICISQPFRNNDFQRVLHLLVPFFLSCFFLEIWGEYAQSRTYTTDFMYCTWFGLVLVLVDLSLLALYLRNLRGTYLNEFAEDKRRFYKLWGMLYSVAFLALPFAALLSALVSPWVRLETIVIVTNSVHVAMLASLIVGLWPEKAHTFFCIDQPHLIKVVGIKSDLLPHSIADASPYLRTRTPKASITTNGRDGCSFGMDVDDDSV